MKAILPLLLCVFVWLACEPTNSPRIAESPIIGKWRLAATRDSSGNWEAATELQMMRINADRTIDYFDLAGQQITACCQPTAYRTETDDKWVFTEWPSCPAVKCALFSSWKIDTLTHQMLEVTPDRWASRRYTKVE